MHPLFPVDTQELDARSTICSTEEESVNCKKFLHAATLRIALMPARLVVSRRTAMLQNPDSPWNPPEPVIITPLEFELQVLEWLKRAPGPSGRYEFDYQGAVIGTGIHRPSESVLRFHAGSCRSADKAKRSTGD
jgi:hypothetical protein